MLPWYQATSLFVADGIAAAAITERLMRMLGVISFDPLILVGADRAPTQHNLIIHSSWWVPIELQRNTTLSSAAIMSSIVVWMPG